MDQSNPCLHTKGDLTKPHLTTRSNIFPMSVLHVSHLSVLKCNTLPYFCTIFFQRDTSLVTAGNETGGKNESGRVASPASVTCNKNGNCSTHL